jgi:hypothetical protein
MYLLVHSLPPWGFGTHGDITAKIVQATKGLSNSVRESVDLPVLPLNGLGFPGFPYCCFLYRSHRISRNRKKRNIIITLYITTRPLLLARVRNCGGEPGASQDLQLTNITIIFYSDQVVF